MISILIPIYNFKVVKLVKKLQKQCERANVDYEILCFDDGSAEKYKKENVVLSDLFRVNYTELSQNLGRARIRNWLMKSASYPYLLFLDCDTKVLSNSFIKEYLKVARKGMIISGGRTYAKKQPRAYTKKLHWLYGTKKESKDAKYRNKFPVQYFHSNNFLADAEIFRKVSFDESLTTYGYEDLLLGKEIIDQGFAIWHIDNPTEHLGLEKNTVFLKKTREAIDNLLMLNNSGHKVPSHLEKMANRLNKMGLVNAYLTFMEKRIPTIEKKLLSKNPKVMYLDLYKLYYFLTKRKDSTLGDTFK